MFVVGTAGHVDHGKSTLVRALTGIDPDRLQEEKDREMTIDLGFAWLRLPSGREVSIVDVPGHERFIKNMLAGVGGIDAALLVIAADEGPMPQTTEHLDILDLLQVHSGVVALTKSDLVDQEWLDLVREEVAERLAATSLAGAPIVAVSARTGEGLETLVRTLDDLLSDATPRVDAGRPRLPIDRVFTVAGFGTVVTGTLVDGSLRLGQELEVLPRRLKTRVRGLQTHKRKLDEVLPGNRVAVNLVGVAVEDLARGNVLAVPGTYAPTTKMDVRLRVLADSPRPLLRGEELDLFIGATETPARLSLLDRDRLAPGDEGWVQLRLTEPVVAARGDRFILRQPSPSETLAGGVVVDPQARRHRRHQGDVVGRLEVLQRGSPAEVVLQAAEVPQPVQVRAIAERSGLPLDLVLGALPALLAEGAVVRFSTSSAGNGVSTLDRQQFVQGSRSWAGLAERVATLLEQYHRQYPLRRGLPKEELKSRLGVEARVFGLVMAQMIKEGRAGEDATTYRLSGHVVTLTPPQQARFDALRAAYLANPYSPPAPGELGLDNELTVALQDRGDLVRVAEGIYFLRETYQEVVDRVMRRLDERGTITAAEVRDLFGTSRKYAVSFLEHLDDIKLTRRQGDERVRR